ncbi:MAG: hypothetical protein RLZZ385_1592 [Pseudomonadota bacterium]|jgi:hypothetical protein
MQKISVFRAVVLSRYWHHRCPGNYNNYDAYGVEVVDMPLFLRDWVVDMFDSAFQEHGMERNDRINDLIVTLSYRHVNLNAEQQDINPFIRQESIEEELRYIAVVEISMRETATGTPVWSGEISRIHTVSPGEYMHEGPARVAFLETFRDLLSNYPSRD